MSEGDKWKEQCEQSEKVQNTRDVAGKEALATITTTDKPLWEVNKYSITLVFLSWGCEAS